MDGLSAIRVHDLLEESFLEVLHLLLDESVQLGLELLLLELRREAKMIHLLVVFLEGKTEDGFLQFLLEQRIPRVRVELDEILLTSLLAKLTHLGVLSGRLDAGLTRDDRIGL